MGRATFWIVLTTGALCGWPGVAGVSWDRVSR